MPRFAANLSMMFNEVPFLDRFALAAKAGFKGVEFLFPYDHPAAEIAARLKDNGLQQVLFNAPAGDFAKGERGMAAIPGKQAAFRDSIKLALEYAAALACPRLHIMAGLKPEGVAHDTLTAVYGANLAYAAEECARLGVKVPPPPSSPSSMSKSSAAESVSLSASYSSATLQRGGMPSGMTLAVPRLPPTQGYPCASTSSMWDSGN